MVTGPEPDAQWERFVAAVGQVADRFAVRLTVGLMAIPMGVPHTRPTGMSTHATRKGLLPEQEDWLGIIPVPGHATGLLEYRFGQAGATPSASLRTCRTTSPVRNTRRPRGR